MVIRQSLPYIIAQMSVKDVALRLKENSINRQSVKSVPVNKIYFRQRWNREGFSIELLIMMVKMMADFLKDNLMVNVTVVNEWLVTLMQWNINSVY